MAKIREPEFDPVLFDIRHVIDIGLQAAQDTRAPKTSDRWSAGSIGYCLRRQFFDRAKVVRTRDDTSGYRTLWVGDSIHHALKQRLRQSGLLIVDELHLVDEARSVSGYVDAVWGGEIPTELLEGEEEYGPAWQDYLVTYRRHLRDAYGPVPFPITGDEFKTQNQWGAEKSWEQGPGFHHVMQVATYYDLYESEGVELPEVILRLGIERWRLTIVAKSDMKMPVFEILPSHREAAHERIETLNGYWDRMEIPPCTCGRNMTWEPKYCPYSNGVSCCDPSLILNATHDRFIEALDSLEPGEETEDG